MTMRFVVTIAKPNADADDAVSFGVLDTRTGELVAGPMSAEEAATRVRLLNDDCKDPAPDSGRRAE